MNLSVTLKTAVGDPLVVVFTIFIIGGLTTYFLFKRKLLVRSIMRVSFLVLLTIAFIRADIVPYQPLQSTGSPLRDAVHGLLTIAWWLWAAWFLVGLLRAVVVIERLPREGKLLQDLLAGLTYLAAFFAIIGFVFDLPVQGVLATSGAVAIILGLALQSTLNDVFSGIVLSFSRPYRPGDWISLEGGTDGRVTEMNWRATNILTGRRDLAIVPNSTIAKSKIVNVSSPSRLHGITLAIALDTSGPPSSGTEILERAILNCALIQASPAPSVVIKSITAGSAEFEITFFVADLASSTKAQNQLFDLIFRHLIVSGLNLAPSQAGNQLDQPSAHDFPREKGILEKLLELVVIFGALTADERAAIAAKLKPAEYERGKTLVEPGTVVSSLFIVGSGVLSLTREDDEGEIEVMRLGPGDHFGEIGMLTGAPAITRISALAPTTVYELAKDDLLPILAARPQVAQELSRALARRQAASQLIDSGELEKNVPASGLTTWFSDRMQRLFDLARAT